jgi:hypothetical protein
MNTTCFQGKSLRNSTDFFSKKSSHFYFCGGAHFIEYAIINLIYGSSKGIMSNEKDFSVAYWWNYIHG